MGVAAKPFPPGKYPLIIVGSGPGALQLTYFLTRRRIKHAVLSADSGPGGMFRRFPFFDRLISWSKPYPPQDAGALCYERFDWNSLLANNPRHAGLVRREMDHTSYFPSRPEMQRGLARFAELTGLQVRYRCRWLGTKRERDTWKLMTSRGTYEAPLIVFGFGVTQPWLPKFEGASFATHYVDLKPPRSYAGKRVVILGKRNSGFETAHGLLPWASRIIMASPSPVKFSIDTRHPSAARAVYMQPYEDHVLAGGHYVLDAIPAAVERTAGALRVHLHGTTTPERWVFEADELIGATGFQAAIGDLPDVGVETFGHQRFPALTPFWESACAPGIYFAGSTSQGATGLKKFGRPSNSGVVNGFRHNARVLAAHLATEKFGRPPERTLVLKRDLVQCLLEALSSDGALWNQQAYLTRVYEVPTGTHAFDTGLQPLAHFLDSAGPPSIAITIETDNSGDIHPTIYARHKGKTAEHVLEAGSLLQFDVDSNRAALRTILKGIGV